MRVAFVHPDLGIGGAERLVVDAAVALRRRQHQVRIFTAHHDPNHCFPETRTELDVVVACEWFPSSFFGRFKAFCAYVRMALVAIYLAFSTDFSPDVIFCDQVSVGIPLLRVFSRAKKIVFYCHFPDQLLTERSTTLKALYRVPIDWLEEKTTAMADKILVNSHFTAGVFHDTFSTIRTTPLVLYPSLNTKQFDLYQELIVKEKFDKFTFVSINRYERKKNIGLAIRAFALLRSRHPNRGLQLVIAGGYDPSLAENHQHYQELLDLASSEGLDEESVRFLRSPSDQAKLELLHRSHGLLYTPSNEHFGIVPLEAMYCGLPVVAAASGGPTETVEDARTGFLAESSVDGFADAMDKLVAMREDDRVAMGRCGRQRVKDRFSFDAFAEELDNVIALN